MPKFEIGWTFGGYTTVEAESFKDARRYFREAIDHAELLAESYKNDMEGLEITDVTMIAEEAK